MHNACFNMVSEFLFVKDLTPNSGMYGVSLVIIPPNVCK